MTLVWLISVRIRNASIVDIFWGIGCLLTALTYFVLSDGFPERQVLVLALVAVWSLRLSGHIASRNLGHGEDYRYRTWRERSPSNFWWISYFQVFLLQGLRANDGFEMEWRKEGASYLREGRTRSAALLVRSKIADYGADRARANRACVGRREQWEDLGGDALRACRTNYFR
jgi:hypothetical protein